MHTNTKIVSFLAVVLLIVIMTHCAPKRVAHPPAPPADLESAKKVPAYAKIPPTQKPYCTLRVDSGSHDGCPSVP